MTKHTAGPWVADNSRFLTSVNSANKKHIAMVNFFSCGKPEFDICGEEHEANARLIAVAPELLEALEIATRDLHEAIYTQAAKTWATEEIAYKHATALTEKYRVLIAKAKGE